MTTTILFSGPNPPDGTYYCMYCAAIHKGYGLTDHAGVIEDAKLLTSKGTKTLNLRPDTSRLELAVSWGVAMMPSPTGQMIPMFGPLCWSHLPGVHVHEGVLPASGDQLPPPEGAAAIAAQEQALRHGPAKRRER